MCSAVIPAIAFCFTNLHIFILLAALAAPGATQLWIKEARWPPVTDHYEGNNHQIHKKQQAHIQDRHLVSVLTDAHGGFEKKKKTTFVFMSLKFRKKNREDHVELSGWSQPLKADMDPPTDNQRNGLRYAILYICYSGKFLVNVTFNLLTQMFSCNGRIKRHKQEHWGSMCRSCWRVLSEMIKFTEHIKKEARWYFTLYTICDNMSVIITGLRYLQV